MRPGPSPTFLKPCGTSSGHMHRIADFGTQGCRGKPTSAQGFDFQFAESAAGGVFVTGERQHHTAPHHAGPDHDIRVRRTFQRYGFLEDDAAPGVEHLKRDAAEAKAGADTRLNVLSVREQADRGDQVVARPGPLLGRWAAVGAGSG